MKKTLIATALLFACTTLFAQKEESKDYKKMKEEIELKIFGSKDPIFETNAIPAALKDESTIVLAQKHFLETDSRKKLSMVGNNLGRGTKYDFSEIFREKIALNDKAAIEEYAQISFNKLQKKSKLIFGKSKYYTFINIRVIKPDGSIKKVNIDESAVTLTEQKDGEKTKIAIPDLNVGDILDYYIAVFYQQDRWAYSNYDYFTFVISDEDPIVNYELDLQFDKRLGIEYQCINGAPDFTLSTDAEESNILKFKMQNLPKAKNQLWTSLARQVPIVRIKYSMGDLVQKGAPTLKQGDVVKANNANEKQQNGFVSIVFPYDMMGYGTGGYFAGGDYKKDKKTYDLKLENPEQALNYYHWITDYSNFNLKTKFANSYSGQSLSTVRYKLWGLYVFLKELGFRSELLLLTGKDDVPVEDAMSLGDFSMLLRTVGDKPLYFSLDDNLNLVNQVPGPLEGMRAKVYPFILGDMNSISKKNKPTEEYVTLPVSSATDNSSADKMTVTLLNDMQTLNVKRNLSAKGHLRKSKQAAIATFNDIALATAKSVGIMQDLQSENDKRSKREQVAPEELSALIKTAEKEKEESFQKEAEDNFDTKVKELKNFKILNMGVIAGSPAFEFEEELNIEGWVKKAGNNYIVEAGKLIGGQLDLAKEQRERTLDVYMPYARSYAYTINFEIPAGYTAEGLDKFNKKTENECGGFKSVATLEGNTIVFKVFKYYSNAFEPVANWKKIIAFLDEGAQFNKEKILLKKK